MEMPISSQNTWLRRSTFFFLGMSYHELGWAIFTCFRVFFLNKIPVCIHHPFFFPGVVPFTFSWFLIYQEYNLCDVSCKYFPQFVTFHFTVLFFFFFAFPIQFLNKIKCITVFSKCFWNFSHSWKSFLYHQVIEEFYYMYFCGQERDEKEMDHFGVLGIRRTVGMWPCCEQSVKTMSLSQ